MTFAIIDAQGHYGSHATVYATYDDPVAAAIAASHSNLTAGRGGPKVTVAQCEAAALGEWMLSTDALRYERRAQATFDALARAQRARVAEEEAAGGRDQSGMRERLALLERWAG